MAANTSMSPCKTLRRRSGAYSAMKSAAKTPIGTAMHSAISATTTVPNNNPATPMTTCLVFVLHAVVVKKRQPAYAQAWRPCQSRKTPTRVSNTRTVTPAASVVMSKRRSARLGLSSMTRRVRAAPDAPAAAGAVVMSVTAVRPKNDARQVRRVVLRLATGAQRNGRTQRLTRQTTRVRQMAGLAFLVFRPPVLSPFARQPAPSGCWQRHCNEAVDPLCERRPDCSQSFGDERVNAYRRQNGRWSGGRRAPSDAEKTASKSGWNLGAAAAPRLRHCSGTAACRRAGPHVISKSDSR